MCPQINTASLGRVLDGKAEDAPYHLRVHTSHEVDGDSKESQVPGT